MKCPKTLNELIECFKKYPGIGEKTAEDLKINIGCVYKDARESSYIMKGRNLVTVPLFLISLSIG